MLVSLNKYKFQIIITTLIGSGVFYYTRNELQSAIITILSMIILRYMDIDSMINKKFIKK